MLGRGRPLDQKLPVADHVTARRRSDEPILTCGERCIGYKIERHLHLSRGVMNRNVGGIDRKARLVAGPILLVVGIVALTGAVQLGTVGTVAAIAVGAILTVTGAVQRCPLNALFGVDTCPIDG
jgi:hypothetical protein